MQKKILKTFIGALILCLVIGAVLIYHGLTAPDFLRPRVASELSRHLQASVEIKGLDFSFFSGTRIETLEIVPEAAEEKAAARSLIKSRIRLSDVHVRHKRLALLFGHYRPHRVQIGHLEAKIARGMRQWLAALDKGAPAGFALPEIAVADGRVRLSAAELKQPIIFENLNFSLQPGKRRRGSRSRLNLDFKGNTLKLRVAAADSRWDAWFSASGFDFSALPSVSLGKKTRLPAGLKVKGDLVGRASIRLPEDANEAPQISGEMRISGISATHPALPAKLENGFARFDFTENTIVLLDGTVNAAGGCIEIPTAGIRFNGGSPQRLWARLDASRLALPFLLSGGGGLLERIPKKFRPRAVSGLAGGDLNIQWTPADGLQYGMRMVLENCAGRIPAFERRFSALDAQLRFTSPGRLIVSRARAQMFGGRVEAVGTCQVGGQGIEKPDLELGLTDVTETRGLVRQLPDKVREFIAKAGLKAPTVAGRISVEPDATRVDLSVHAKAAQLPDLPMRLDTPRADVRWASGSRRVVFENAGAKVGGSSLAVTGALKLGDPMRMDVSLSGRYLSLNSRLLRWLGLELDDWTPGGAYDVELRARDWWPSGSSAAEFLENMRVQVDLRDAGLRHPNHGQILEHVYGHIAIGPEGAFLSNMIGNLCGVAVRGGGRLPVGQGSQAPYFHLESENVLLNEALFDRIPLDLGLEGLGLSGQCSLNAELQGTQSDAKGLSANINAALHHVELTVNGEPVTAGGSARVRIDASDWRQPVVSGSMSLDQLTYGNLAADRVTADYAWEKGRLEANDVIMRVYGGKISFSETRVRTGDGQWHTQAALSHLDLESLLGAFGIEGRYAPSGTIRGDIRMTGVRSDLGALNGEGNVKITQGRLYSFPMLVAVFNLLDLQSPRQSPVSDAYGDFRIRGGRLQITDLLFSGGTVPAHLQGDVILDKKGGLREKPIDFLITVAAKKGILDQIPFINWAKHYTIDYLRRLVFQVKIDGTLGDYEIDTISSPVTDPIRKMFSLLKKFTSAPPEGN